MTKPINELMQKDMSRKEFLGTLGLGIVSIFGFAHVFHLFTGKSLTIRHINGGSGFGASRYGR